MPEPLSLAVDLVSGLLSRVEGVNTNRDGCELLARLAAQVLEILQNLSGRNLDSSVTKALELVNDALIEAQDVVDKCCNASWITAMLYYESYASSLHQAAEKLERALSRIPARFEERAQIADQTKALKDAFEKAFYQGGQGTEEIKNLVQELLHQHSSSKEERENELKMLQEFEINQIIEVLSESL